VLRGAAAGSLTTFLALLFHVLGGGIAPPAAAVGGFVLASVWISVVIGRRRPSLPLLILAVAVSQAVLHTGFEMTSSSVVLLAPGGAGLHAGHELSLGPVVLAHAGGAMWLAHLAAGVLTVLGIRHGEAVLRRLAEAAHVVLVRLQRLPMPAPLEAPARAAVLPRPAGPLLRRLLRSVLLRRGPPALAA